MSRFIDPVNSFLVAVLGLLGALVAMTLAPFTGDAIPTILLAFSTITMWAALATSHLSRKTRS